VLRQVWTWGGSLWQRWRNWRTGQWKLVYVEDPPELVKKGRLCVVGTKDDPYQIVMGCPCGCSSPIYLDLVPSKTGQHWKVSEDSAGTPTLSPSVWRTDQCKSHFWLRGGKIVWC